MPTRDLSGRVPSGSGRCGARTSVAAQRSTIGVPAVASAKRRRPRPTAGQALTTPIGSPPEPPRTLGVTAGMQPHYLVGIVAAAGRAAAVRTGCRRRSMRDALAPKPARGERERGCRR
jgi:hypothetical protein